LCSVAGHPMRPKIGLFPSYSLPFTNRQPLTANRP
jgi:hypothetical protein